MSRAEIMFPALILAFTATFLALGNFVYAYSWTSFAFPLMVGAVLCVLCAARIVTALAGPHATAPRTNQDEPVPLSLSSLAWMFALALFLYGLGFVAGPAAYLLACLRANGFSWSLALAVAGSSLLVTWGLFIHVMSILLPIWPLWWPS
jgi:hypothetical protein